MHAYILGGVASLALLKPQQRIVSHVSGSRQCSKNTCRFQGSVQSLSLSLSHVYVHTFVHTIFLLRSRSSRMYISYVMTDTPALDHSKMFIAFQHSSQIFNVFLYNNCLCVHLSFCQRHLCRKYCAWFSSVLIKRIHIYNMI